MNELINLGNGQFVKITMLKGEKGSNIATITKTATSGLTDTYTITLTDGSTTTFNVTNGSSIDHITKTSTVGSVDTYTIYLTDGTVGGTFEVNNAVATIDQNFSETSTNPLMNKTLTNIIAGVENGSTASKTYYENDIILRNDSLYMVTTTVATGTAWADGVNISEKTLGELIGGLKASLTDKTNKYSGTSGGATYVTVDSIGYDSTNKKLGLKVNGADTVIPFSSGEYGKQTLNTSRMGNINPWTFTFDQLSEVGDCKIGYGLGNITTNVFTTWDNPSMFTLDGNTVEFSHGTDTYNWTVQIMGFGIK